MTEPLNVTEPASLAILISGRGSNMVAIAEACADGTINAKVNLVISNVASAPGLAKAKALGIATEVIPHENYDSREEFDLAMNAVLERVKPDWVLLAGFMRILSVEFISRWQPRILNIHPSLLPKYPGLNTHQRAIDAGDSVAGATVHLVTQDLDQGPIIAQVQIPILANDSATRLADRVINEEHALYVKAVKQCLAAD